MSLAARARLTGHRSQQTFDTLLRTLAEPGTVRSLPAAVVDPEIPCPCLLALALADVDVAVNVSGGRSRHLGQLVRDATGATVVPLERAWLAVLLAPTGDELDRLSTGDALHPELGARVGLAVTGLHAGDGGAMRLGLEGPGVPGRRILGVDGLGAGVLRRLGRASGTYPAGFDTWLFAPAGQVAAISRSTTVLLDTERTRSELVEAAPSERAPGAGGS